MKSFKTVACLLLVTFLGWQANIVNSAVIVQKPNDSPPALYKDDANNTELNLRLFQEALSDYAVRF